MKTTNKLAGLLLLVAICSWPRPAGAKIVEGLAASVNDEPITLSEYEKQKAELAEQYSAAMPEFFQQETVDRSVPVLYQVPHRAHLVPVMR